MALAFTGVRAEVSAETFSYVEKTSPLASDFNSRLILQYRNSG